MWLMTENISFYAISHNPILRSPIDASPERRDAGLRPPEDEGMNVVRAFIGVDRLEIHHVADDVILVRDAIAAVHVPGDPGDVERLAAIVALQQRDHLRRRASFVLEPTQPQAGVE